MKRSFVCVLLGIACCSCTLPQVPQTWLKQPEQPPSSDGYVAYPYNQPAQPQVNLPPVGAVRSPIAPPQAPTPSAPNPAAPVTNAPNPASPVESPKAVVQPQQPAPVAQAPKPQPTQQAKPPTHAQAPRPSSGVVINIPVPNN
jgi:hypothetical protein